MNSKLRKLSRFVRLPSFLCLAAVSACLATAQTNNTSAAPDVELPARMLFPTNLALLPGKGPVSSWKGFLPLWTQRRALFLKHRDEDKGAVVFLGDSITQGWWDLAQAFPGLKVANRGIGGDTTRGVLFRLKDDVCDLKPSAVVLLIGINDIGNGGKPAEIADNTHKILSALLKSNRKMPIVVCKVMPSKRSNAQDIQTLNALMDKIVSRDRRLIRCDTWSIYANPDGTCNRNEFPDMLHPNKGGYEKWAAALKPIFARLNLESRKTD